MSSFLKQLVRLSHGENVWDVMAVRRRWYLITAAVLLVCVLGLAVRGLNLGIEFRGGAEFRAPVDVTATTVDDTRQAVEQLDLPDMTDITVTTIGDHTVSVQTRTLTTEEVTAVRAGLASFAQVQADQVSYSLIGASWGQQITQKGIIALAVFLVLVGLTISIYFRDWKMAVAAIAAVLHDLVVTIGVYAWVGFTVSPATLTAVLTILGYSLYDTVVVFDKVRENVRELRSTQETYAGAANRALNEVLIRSINTTIIGVLPIFALLIAGVFVLGTGPIKDLSLAMFVGMLAGAYSSIFVATSLLVDMKIREPQMVAWQKTVAERAERARELAAQGAGNGVAVGVQVADGDESGVDLPTADMGAATGGTAGVDGDRHQPSRLPRSRRKAQE